MSENKVNGPEDAVVSEIIEQLLSEKIYTITRCFQERFTGQMEAPSSWKIVKLVFSRKPDAESKKEIRSCRAIALTSVVSKWYASCFILRLEKEKEPESWKRLHVGAYDGISRQYLKFYDDKSASKELGMAGGEDSPVEAWQCGASDNVVGQAWTSRRRSMRQDRGTLQKLWRSHNTHGWIIFSLLREMCGLESQTMFEFVESIFSFNRCLRQGSVRSSQTMAKDVHEAPGKCGGKMSKEKNGQPFRLGNVKGHVRCAVSCGPTTSGSCPTLKSSGTDVAGSNAGSREVGLGPKAGESMVDEYFCF